MARKTNNDRSGNGRTATARPAPTTRKATTATQAPSIRAPRKAAGNGAARDRQDPRLEPFVLSHELIAQRAYQLWQQTGNPDEQSNWELAERQLKQELGQI